MFQKVASNREIRVSLTDLNVTMLGLDTVNYSAADIANVIKDACMGPIREIPFEEIMEVSSEEVLCV